MVLLGIAGSLADDVFIGDVVVADSVWCWMEGASLIDLPAGAAGSADVSSANNDSIYVPFAMKLHGPCYKVSHAVNAADHFRTAHPASFKQWRHSCSADARAPTAAQYTKLHLSELRVRDYTTLIEDSSLLPV